MNREPLWLERDDDTALFVKRPWLERAKRRAKLAQFYEDEATRNEHRMLDGIWAKLCEIWQAEDEAKAVVDALVGAQTYEEGE